MFHGWQYAQRGAAPAIGGRLKRAVGNGEAV
jgi:hypothetical protein